MATRPGTPLDAPSGQKPSFYFDNSDASKRTLDSSGAVASRADISGNSVAASQATAASRPTPTGIAGQTAVQYDGTRREIAPVSITGKTLTYFAVIQQIATTTNGGYDRFASFGRSGVYDYSDAGSFDVEQNNGAQSIRITQNSVQTAAVAYVQGKPLILEVVFDGTNATLYVTGNGGASFACSATFNIVQAVFGQSNVSADGFTGLQGAQVVFNRALSTAERAKVRGLLAWQFGGSGGYLVGQLPSADPYKTSAPSGSILDLSPLFYFDATNPAGQTFDATTGYFATRTDTSTNQIVAKADTAAARPRPSGVGALPSIFYTGGQSDAAPVSITGNTLTYFAVLQTDGVTSYGRFASLGRDGAADYQDPGSFDVERNVTDSAIRLSRNSSASSNVSITEKVPLILEVVYDGTKGTLYVTGNGGVTLANTANFNIARALFGTSTQSDNWSGQQSAQLAYPVALSTADRAWIRGCLAWQFDGGMAGPLVNQLPANDPYKTARPTVTTGGTDYPVSLTDTGTGTDIPTARAAAPCAASDAGTGSDAQSTSAAASVSATDSGTPTDASNSSAAVPATISDSGAGTDTASYISANTGSATDTGAGSDTSAATTASSANFSDLGTGSDLSSTQAATSVSLTDSGAGSDASTGRVAAQASLTEAGAGSDASTASTSAQASAADQGTGSDAVNGSSANTGSASDQGTASDAAAASAQASTTVTDTGSGTDSAVGSAARSANTSDAGTATDQASATTSATASTADTGTAVDNVSARAASSASASDQGTGSDAATAAAANTGSISDAGGGTDAVTAFVTVVVAVNDNGAGSDAASASATDRVAIADTGAGIDTASVRVVVAVASSDAGTGTDAVYGTLPNSLTLADIGSGSDTIAVVIASLPRAQINQTGAYNDNITQTGAFVDTVSLTGRYG